MVVRCQVLVDFRNSHKLPLSVRPKLSPSAIQDGTQPRTGSFQWYVDRALQLPGHMGACGAIMIL